MLLKEIIITLSKIHLNKIHFLKDEIFQFEFESSNETYCIHVINKVEKISVYNVNENTRKCLTMHIRNMLLKAMIIAVQKMYLNEVYFLRNKISQFESENLKSHNDKTLTH